MKFRRGGKAIELIFLEEANVEIIPGREGREVDRIRWWHKAPRGPVRRTPTGIRRTFNTLIGAASHAAVFIHGIETQEDVVIYNDNADEGEFRDFISSLRARLFVMAKAEEKRGEQHG